MRTLAIVLGDNDFGNTFHPLLKGLKAILADRGEVLSRMDIEIIIRQSIMAYYVGYQYTFLPGDYMSETHEAHLAHIAKYLSRIRVLFDEEAERDIVTEDHDHGAWYLEIQSGRVEAY